MRRRFGKLVDKVLDRPQSPGPVNPRPNSSAKTNNEGSLNSNPDALSDSLNTLTARYHNLQHAGLKQSASNLIALVTENSVEDSIDLNKLGVEINRISDVFLLLQEKDNLSKINRQLDGLANSITSATKDAQILMTKDGVTEKLGITKVLLGLSDELRLAVDEFETAVADSDLFHRTAPDTRTTARTVSGRVVGALTIAKESLDGVPVLGLKAAIGGLLEVLKTINKLVDNEDDLVKLVDHLQRLMKIATPPANAEIDTVDPPLQARMNDLTNDIQQITIDAKKLEKQNISNKFLGSADNASFITALGKAVDQAVDRFQIAGGIAIERNLRRLHPGVGRLEEGVGRLEDGSQQIEEGVGQLRIGIEKVGDSVGMIGKSVERLETVFLQMQSSRLSSDEEMALNVIHPHADKARYDSLGQTSSSFCLEDTRVSILEKVEQWVVDSTAPPIFWLCGMAGTGKSTIARTVAKRIDENHFLGATFFFSRDEDDCRTTNLVFTTIAYQLARRNSSFRPRIIGAASPDVCTAMMRTQLQKLIVEPLQYPNTASSSPIVIIMDALDECADESRITEMLILLAPAIQTLRKSINIKLFVTSRPEVHITSEFTEPGMEAVSRVSVLHDIEKSLVQADIRLYIGHHLGRIAKAMLPKSAAWPLAHEIDMLVDLADGLFIFAAVTMGYIGDTKHRQPKQRLRNVLSATAQHQRTRSLKQLDLLYQQVLMASLPDSDEDSEKQEVVDRILTILGAVVLLMNPLSTASLEKLLLWEEDTVESVLGPFHSILSVPSAPNPVRVFHKSFPDFLTDKQRSGDLWFHVDSKKQHTELALLCLTHMNSCLERDMCGVGNRLVSEIDDVDGLLRTRLEDHILYACQHWGHHLKEANYTQDLITSLDEFCRTKILYWVEIMTLSGRLDMGVSVLRSAYPWADINLKVHSETKPADFNDFIKAMSIQTILYDCYRFLLSFHKTIALGPSHIYQSALPFIQRFGLLPKWEKELGDSLVLKTQGDDIWNATLFTLSSHTQDVYGVAYSPDSKLLASCSGDHSIIIWDCKSGVQINTLTGHSDVVLCVAFSPHGARLASGGRDTIVYLWNPRTSAQIHALSGHLSEVHTVAFSPDGTLLASGSSDARIILWNAGSGSVTRILSGHSQEVHTVVFSPDGTRIASGSADALVAVWDTVTGTLLKSLKGHSRVIKTVAFSPDGNQIASGSDDESIRIWDSRQGVLVDTLTGHSNSVTSIAFTSDGTWMISGFRDQAIGVWEVSTSSLTKVLYSHSGDVYSVAISPDGTQIASGSSDNSVIVWDLSRLDFAAKPNKPHTDAVLSIAFSPDGNQVASGSMDTTIVIWGAKTGVPVYTLRGHIQGVVRVQYSRDNKRMFSASLDQTINIWDPKTGDLVYSHISRKGSVMPTTLSPDSPSIVSEGNHGAIDQPDGRTLDKSSSITGTPPRSTKSHVNSRTESYLDREHDSGWVIKRSSGTAERLCFLPHHGISTHSSLGHTFAYGTRGGMVYIIDFSRKFPGVV